MKLLFATSNLNKLHEVRKALDPTIELIGLKDIGFDEDIPEDHDTLSQNALQKANYLFRKFQISCFSDDTGLEIDALDGRPGVYSARYAGVEANAENNMNLVLTEMDGIENRAARFKTVIALIIDEKEHLFDGIVEGTILHQRTGDAGFGYDPIFRPYGSQYSFAQMDMEAKNKISHRGIAIRKLTQYINQL